MTTKLKPAWTALIAALVNSGTDEAVEHLVPHLAKTTHFGRDDLSIMLGRKALHGLVAEQVAKLRDYSAGEFLRENPDLPPVVFDALAASLSRSGFASYLARRKDITPAAAVRLSRQSRSEVRKGLAGNRSLPPQVAWKFSPVVTCMFPGTRYTAQRAWDLLENVGELVMTAPHDSLTAVAGIDGEPFREWLPHTTDVPSGTPVLGRETAGEWLIRTAPLQGPVPPAAMDTMRVMAATGQLKAEWLWNWYGRGVDDDICMAIVRLCEVIYWAHQVPCDKAPCPSFVSEVNYAERVIDEMVKTGSDVRPSTWRTGASDAVVGRVAASPFRSLRASSLSHPTQLPAAAACLRENLDRAEHGDVNLCELEEVAGNPLLAVADATELACWFNGQDKLHLTNPLVMVHLMFNRSLDRELALVLLDGTCGSNVVEKLYDALVSDVRPSWLRRWMDGDVMVRAVEVCDTYAGSQKATHLQTSVFIGEVAERWPHQTPEVLDKLTIKHRMSLPTARLICGHFNELDDEQLTVAATLLGGSGPSFTTLASAAQALAPSGGVSSDNSSGGLADGPGGR